MDVHGLVVQKIEAELAKPKNSGEEDDVVGLFDPWEVIGIPYGNYNGAVDRDMLAVLDGIAENKFVKDIARDTGLSETHVELIQYIFCSAEFCEYGTSPRGCWIVHSIRPQVDRFRARWSEEFDRSYTAANN